MEKRLLEEGDAESVFLKESEFFWAFLDGYEVMVFEMSEERGELVTFLSSKDRFPFRSPNRGVDLRARSAE